MELSKGKIVGACMAFAAAIGGMSVVYSQNNQITDLQEQPRDSEALNAMQMAHFHGLESFSFRGERYLLVESHHFAASPSRCYVEAYNEETGNLLLSDRYFRMTAQTGFPSRSCS